MDLAEKTIQETKKVLDSLCRDLAEFEKTTVKFQKDRILQKGVFGNKTKNLIKLGVKII